MSGFVCCSCWQHSQAEEQSPLSAGEGRPMTLLKQEQLSALASHCPLHCHSDLLQSRQTNSLSHLHQQEQPQKASACHSHWAWNAAYFSPASLLKRGMPSSPMKMCRSSSQWLMQAAFSVTLYTLLVWIYP